MQPISISIVAVSSLSTPLGDDGQARARPSVMGGGDNRGVLGTGFRWRTKLWSILMTSSGKFRRCDRLP